MGGVPALRGVDKAALLIATLDEEAAASIVKSLGPAEISRLGSALRRLEAIDPLLEHAILGESHRLLVGPQTASRPSGADVARRVLTRALGAEAADRILGDAQDEASRALLRSTPPARLAAHLAKEQPQTIAVVLRQIPPKAAAEALAALPEEMRGAVLRGLAGSTSPPPALVRRISAVLRSHLASDQAAGVGAEEEEPAGAGLNHAIEMLRQVGRARSRDLLTALEGCDAESAGKIRDRLFLFEDLAALPARALGEILRGVDAKKLATALKGAEEAIREKFLAALSERAAQMIRDEMEYLQGARVKDIEDAQKEIRDLALQLEAAGTINLEETQDAAAAPSV